MRGEVPGDILGFVVVEGEHFVGELFGVGDFHSESGGEDEEDAVSLEVFFVSGGLVVAEPEVSGIGVVAGDN